MTLITTSFDDFHIMRDAIILENNLHGNKFVKSKITYHYQHNQIKKSYSNLPNLLVFQSLCTTRKLLRQLFCIELWAEVIVSAGARRSISVGGGGAPPV